MQEGENNSRLEDQQTFSSSFSSEVPLITPQDLEAAQAAERARLRRGIIHVRIRNFYCTLEEMLDPTLRGQSFVVGTGTGRPNEPGRVIDASPAAQRLGISPGMPLRRAHRLAPRTRFLAASYDRYQSYLQKLRDSFRTYSRIIETIPPADAFIDLRGCERSFISPVELGEQLCKEISALGFSPLIGIANGKAIAELAALMSRKDNREGVLYIPPGREASFVHSLPLSMLLQMGTAGNGTPGALPELASSPSSRPPEIEGKSEQIDPVAVSEAVSHLRDFGITSFEQITALSVDGLTRRLGRLGGWIFQIAQGEDASLVVPDAPPLSQNARVRLQHPVDADEACSSILKLANYLSARLQEQRLKGQSIALILWPYRMPRMETRKLVMNDEGEEVAVSPTEDTIGGQMFLSRHTDESDVIGHHSLMLFAHYHKHGNRYLQVQLRIGDMIATTSSMETVVPRSRHRSTRKL